MKIYVVKIIDISEQQIDKLCLLVNSDKRYKIKNFIKKKDRIRSLIGEILIRTIIGEELHIGNKDIRFEKNKYGKPYMKEYPKFNFNISHSGDFVVCAIDDQFIGIDIEKVKHIECEEIARNFFTTTERSYIANEDLNIKLSKFYDIWTLKESYIKCCGQGLSIPLKSFSMNIDEYGRSKVIINNENKECKFKSFDIESCYKMAVCSLSKKVSNRIIRIEPNDLINSILN